jgi:hypothetical protein
MSQRQKVIILGAIGSAFVIFWVVILALIIKTLSLPKESSDAPVTEVTLCDENASDLCIVTFGANSLNRMVINFQLPNTEYAPFYVKADNRGTVNVYSCEVDESTPANAHCTGVRTPLGETIDIEVYTTEGDKLIARGTFLVSAIAISTPISLPSETPSLETPTQEEVPTEEPTPTPPSNRGVKTVP